MLWRTFLSIWFWIICHPVRIILILARIVRVTIMLLVLTGTVCFFISMALVGTEMGHFFNWLVPPILSGFLFLLFVLACVAAARPKTPGERLDYELRKLKEQANRWLV